MPDRAVFAEAMPERLSGRQFSGVGKRMTDNTSQRSDDLDLIRRNQKASVWLFALR